MCGTCGAHSRGLPTAPGLPGHEGASKARACGTVPCGGAQRPYRATSIPPPPGSVNREFVRRDRESDSNATVHVSGFAWPHKNRRRLPSTLSWLRGVFGVGVAICVCVASSAEHPSRVRAAPSASLVVAYDHCLGWGLCVFRPLADAVTPPTALALSSSASPPPSVLTVRLRGVGDPALGGTCTPEREEARIIRGFVEGILARAGKLTLGDVAARPDGSVLATVRADGTNVADILIHIGLGREKPLPPGATWCD
jgi:hypothetical protein